MAIYNTTSASKKPTNVSINAELLAKAKSLNINLSATLESALKEQIRLQAQAQWLKENSDAMEAYNQFVERNGTFSDSVS
ncbi:type II toxin-antitoxin system CcdA family antitoxin [Idiomarina aminovorans]|uniref:type II toxin-antitoxin system CcdA family antitoxin n=1 Tax=Idiomarina aminovorans TaxID=2914829 RepID=UPI0020043A73|nr:type II toxin-antitoxin system CcdA family antitoxin [Idiomarina sp. ATCH4]MCK7458798.1 type II toxin-antitoxin system CcdA family antitoxin [Idiomarina sp. ATCH4]